MNGTEDTTLARVAIASACRESSRIASELLAVLRVPGPEDRLKLCHQLQTLLRQLWQRRTVREDEWAEVVTYLQVSLTPDAIPSLTAKNVEAIVEVISILGRECVDVDELRRARDLLVAGDLDP